MDKKFLPEIVWNVDAQLLNSFLSDDRIHVVSDRDYLGLTGSISSTWCFRTLDGDIYIRYSFIQQTENRDIHRKVGDKMFTYKWFDWHSVLIHEMIHSMSAMNYFVSDDNGTLKYDQRRIWLRHIIRDKNWKLLWETWRSMNEAATESLSWEILRRWFNSFKQPIDISYLRDSNISYKGFINVIDQLQEIDHIKHEDFWKAMLIRKRAKDKSVEWNTPLFELMSKVNWRVEKNWRVRYTRPDYYDLLSNSMDFAHEVFNDKVKRNQAADFETKWIVDFITKKDINILKNYVRSQHKTLRDVFDKSLLTKNWGDFKKDILDTYNWK